MKPLESDDIRELLRRAIADAEKGLGQRHLNLAQDAEDFLVETTAGDARIALNALESASMQAEDGGDITLEMAEQALQRKAGASLTLEDRSPAAKLPRSPPAP